ncbi:hypothetical protein COX68_03845 [Candidatus Falkowbacteria bacterium CG_4_10_14_0_2_um_filter_41_15]|uniref:Uncharacterized protein n=4 Tax=Candidatus Falkowiibacteriota TaxID=1752728 RepID=A0A2G9ZMJ9_9BACT|nr:MAG: hypothetical protein AUJ35_03400 [Candidatus Falkowbacteria bacterium CG1_02_41_21]PIP34413.1 MAG: hypothetical protein COX21_02995 [Candidatus Falkowbacteria bacterium CG23_combo_of_CG06-09_8_20_14_all_41_10]PIZ09947.1 MAG: hypothetical protein COY54_02070 [Candidatus Falkowbacteria bacterium CG_4_10_14_0_8_um_filter_41_36]PJA08802.1 MAG: hypothetical protein COX68_03845 [Candidatus Falkowbacteria bacterium CG_4_10_14_0_2_um_filter_41_15]
MFDFLLIALAIKKCPRCQKLFGKKKKEWEKDDKTQEVISKFNSNKLLIENFGKIKFKDTFCPDCQSLLPDMTVAKFNGLVAVSEK